MLICERKLNTETNEPTMVLDGLAQPTATETTATEVYWRWTDEPDMEFQFLGKTAPGSSLVVPFDLKGRSILLAQIGYTALGRPTDTDLKQAEYTIFEPPANRADSFVSVAAGEDLAQNDLVNLYNDAGTLKARKADANTSPPRPADGWASETVSTGNYVIAYLTSTLVTGMSGLTPGSDYYLSATAGAVTATAPSSSANIRQRVGKALSATVLSFERGEPVVIR